MSELVIRGIPLKKNIYWIYVEFGDVTVREKDLDANLGQWYRDEKTRNNQDVAWGQFYMPVGGKMKAQYGKTFENNFAKLWANRAQNGLVFRRGSMHLKGSGPDNIHSMGYYLWLKKDLEHPPGLSGRVDAVLNATNGKVIRYQDQHGKTFAPTQQTDGLGIFQFALGVLFQWVFGALLLAVAAYLGYVAIKKFLIRPMETASNAITKTIEKGGTVVTAGALGLLGLLLWSWGRRR